MKRPILLAIFLFAAALPLRAQSTDDQYIIIYSLMQQADSLANSGQPQQALAQYVEVQGELQRFQKIYPDWNPNIVTFRLNYLAEKIAELSAQLPATNAPPQNAVETNATSVSTPGSSSANLTAELNSLRAQVQNLQDNNTMLEAKLKEALTAQPTMIDSRSLANAREQIRSLMKENDLLKVAMSQNRQGNAAGLRPQELAQAQSALTEANQKLSEQMERVNHLTTENQSLRARVQSLLASPDAIEALREENAFLKKELAGLKTTPTANAPEIARLNSDLADARRQITNLQTQVQFTALEKTALQERIQRLQAAAIVPATNVANQTEYEARIQALTQERDDLLAKLGAANQEIYGRKKQSAAAQINQLTDEVSALRARLAVDEAQAVPYTPEELALFKQSTPQPSNPNAEKKSIQEMPEGSAQLVAEAQNYFAARQYDKAEDDYQKILQHDQNNGYALANLAAIELQEGKLDEAEKHINAALAQSPSDAYNLSTLGYLKFRQGKYDEALDALSRAAKLDPQNPEIQNYLGVTLSHKGMRAQAETALRKAIQLDPNYGPAHNNLAVIYIRQQPPLAELARWHYQKALEAGQPRNPELEKLLAEKGAPANTQ